MIVTIALVGAAAAIALTVSTVLLLLPRRRKEPAPLVHRFEPPHPPDLVPMTARIAIGELPPRYQPPAQGHASHAPGALRAPHTPATWNGHPGRP